MIRINLLPVKDIKRRNAIKNQLLFFIVGFISYLSILALIGIFQYNKISFNEKEVQSLQQEKQKFTATLNEIKKLEEEKELIETRIGVIKQLKESSSLTVHILDEVANLIPNKRMWLSGMSQSGNSLKLSGMALDNQTVAKFMDDLEGSQYLDNVALSNSSMKQYAERNLKSFSLTGNARVPAVEGDPKAQTNN
jgi:type IV pilus assembly protein PilN